MIRLTAGAIYGSELHMLPGTFHGMQPGTIVSHEGVGTIDELQSTARGASRAGA